MSPTDRSEWGGWNVEALVSLHVMASTKDEAVRKARAILRKRAEVTSIEIDGEKRGEGK